MQKIIKHSRMVDGRPEKYVSVCWFFRDDMEHTMRNRNQCYSEYVESKLKEEDP